MRPLASPNLSVNYGFQSTVPVRKVTRPSASRRRSACDRKGLGVCTLAMVNLDDDSDDDSSESDSSEAEGTPGSDEATEPNGHENEGSGDENGAGKTGSRLRLRSG